MRFKCGPTADEAAERLKAYRLKQAERRATREAWHRWFAWYPVKIEPGHYRWLEVVERRGVLWKYGWGETSWVYTYRPAVDR